MPDVSYRDMAIENAREILKEKGITCVHTDRLKNVSDRIIQYNFQNYVTDLVSDTLYWES